MSQKPENVWSCLRREANKRDLIHGLKRDLIHLS